MNRVHGLLLTSALVVTSFGCGNVVTTAGSNDDSTTGGNVGGNGNTTTVSTGVSTGSAAGGSGPGQSTSIATTNNDKLEVEIATYEETCGLDNFPTCGPTDSWQVRFDLPLASVQPGFVTPLSQANGFASGSVAQSPQDPPGTCAGGGGSFWDGTVTVLWVSATKVGLRLSGTNLLGLAPGDADGDYEVLLCGAKPPPGHALSSAIATPSSVTAGNLTLYANDAPSTCADPNNNAKGCTTAHKYVAIELPPAMQTYGTYSLDQLATFSEWSPDGQGSCSGGGGSYWGGTIQITGIDASSVSFTLSGTDASFSGGTNADGTYFAPRCQ